MILSIKDFTKRQGKSQSEIQTKSRKRKHDFQHGKRAGSGWEIFLK